MLTDSGGYQVMSLAKLRAIDESGVTFRSHLDGTRFHLTPERSIEIQRLLGADIAMAFDECTKFPATPEEAGASMELSMRWAARSKAAFAAAPGRALFGIVQGGVYAELRQRSAASLRAIGFDGYAVGGLAVGEGRAAMFAVLDETVPALPQEAPRYLMGVGKPEDIVGAVARGIDLFDCVLPTRSGRTARPSRGRGTVNLRNARHLDDPRPLDDDVRVRGVPRLFARLSPSSRAQRRDPRQHALDRAQSALLSGPDGGFARGDRGGDARGIRARLRPQRTTRATYRRCA